MIFIFLLSAQHQLPGPSGTGVDFVFKKLSHIFVYAMLYVLWYRALGLIKSRRQVLIPLLIGIVYAFTDEFHQMYVWGRTPRLRDVGYDTVGMLLALLWRVGYI